MIPAINHRRLLGRGAACHVGIVMAAIAVSGVSNPAALHAGSPIAGHGHRCEHGNGACGPHCPVRPGLYGFYGTQWRQWPGQGFMSSQESPAATPVLPPRTAVPGPDEESIRPRADEAIVPLPEPSEPESEVPAPPTDPEPPAAPRTPPPPPPPAPAPLPVTPSSSAPEDDNLFNTRYRPKSMEKLSVGFRATKPKADGDEAGNRPVRSANHLAPADVTPVPRVRFDPAAEIREVRIRIR